MNELMNSVFDSVFDDLNRMTYNTVKASVCSTNGFPFGDISDDDKGYYIEIGLAGYSEKDISVKYEDGWLIVTGKAPKRDSKRHYVRTSLKFVDFTVKYGIDTDKYDVNKCKVTMENGMLYIDVPTKKDFIKSKTFSINAN